MTPQMRSSAYMIYPIGWVRRTICNASMGYSPAVQHKKIIVMGHHHPYIVRREGSWHVITSAQQTDVGRDDDIHAIPPQTVGNGVANMLI